MPTKDPVKRRAILARYDHSPKGRAAHRKHWRSVLGRSTNTVKKRRQRRDPKYCAKTTARQAVRFAIATGQLVRPKVCPRCHETPPLRIDGRSRIQFHHTEGYATEKHLVGEFLCERCHRAE